MTKADFLYELIDKCMLITCQNNILFENIELLDDDFYYESNERQFCDCLEFYEKIEKLCKTKQIDNDVMTQELNTIILLMRQNAINQLYGDFRKYIESTDIENKEILLEQLMKELQSNKVESDFLLKKVREYRKLE